MMVLAKAFRAICILLDAAVYQCVDWFYQLFMMLAETGIFSSGDIRNFADRMYFFLGLIMIFKVSISIIQYIMNPDSVKDNKVGAPKLLKNVVIILIGIVLIPYVFEAAYSLQRIVLKDNVIGSLILGMKYSDGDNAKDYINNAGNRMAFSTFTAFFHYDTNYISDECSNNPFKYAEGSGTAEISDACATDANSAAIDEFIKSNGGLRYKEAYEKQNMLKLANMNVYNYTIKYNDEDEFLFSYSVLITTLAGGFLAYILLLFCFDIAVRSVKLGFLQLIAPIPLIAKIDPKKGDEVFNKWVKECTSTYLMLFIRLVAIYFAIFIISIIGDGMFNVVEPDKKWNNPFVFVFIIFGTLLFVKDLPKLIETITGMKLGGNGLSLKKKLGGLPLAGGVVAGAGALGANALNGIRNNRGKGAVGKTLRSAIAGAGSGLFRGIGAELKGKNSFEATKLGMKGAVDARNLRIDRIAAGDGGPKGIARRAGVAINNAAGITSGVDKFDKQIKYYDQFLKEQSDLESYIEGEILNKGKGRTSTTFTWKNTKGEDVIGDTGNVNVLKNEIDELKNNFGTAEEIANAELRYNKAISQAKLDYIDDHKQGTGSEDTVVVSKLSNMNYINETAEVSGFDQSVTIDSGDAVDKYKKAIKSEKTKVMASTDYRQAQVNKKNDSKK